MGLSAENLHIAMAALMRLEPAFASAVQAVGNPDPRISPPGYGTLLRTILGQQVSVSSAQATWDRLDAALGNAADPALLVKASDDLLRKAGLSRQKAGYARSLAALVLADELDLQNLPQDDEAAIAALTRVKGIGRWSAEIYLLFSEGRADIWPAGDLAVQIAIGKIIGLAERPSEKTLRIMAEAWRPHRGAAAIFAWHHYLSQSCKPKDTMPI